MQTTLYKTVPERMDFLHWQGDGWEPEPITAYLGGEVVDGEVVGGQLVDFTGHDARLQLRRAADQVLAKTLDNDTNGGVALTSEGVITLSMTGAATANMDPGEYVYDLQITPPGGGSQPKTYLYGSFTLINDITKNT